MKYYIYRLSGHNVCTKDPNFENLERRGLRGVIPETHPDIVAYLNKHPDYQTLYIETAPCKPHQSNGECLIWTRDYSTMQNANINQVNRLLTVRSEWSRK